MVCLNSSNTSTSTSTSTSNSISTSNRTSASASTRPLLHLGPGADAELTGARTLGSSTQGILRDAQPAS